MTIRELIDSILEIDLSKGWNRFIYGLIHVLMVGWLIGLFIYMWPLRDKTPMEYLGYFAGIFVPAFFFDRWKREWRWKNVDYPKVAKILTEAADDALKQDESKSSLDFSEASESLSISKVRELDHEDLEREAESFGIKHEGGKYRYGVYKYEKLIDAINYARLQASKSKI
ncbi:hypothetical protein G6653_06440 [Polynucleobacter paneuropaeus]|jgi:hypothetical protein|nr:hypothetical protein [Polynucleobacter paneuropaeus]MBT8582408.1 hypothetical protein [Polynucleobacter paneuropaeus]MBT8611198.1 hypothetical protein [Polynucleobacter paneuropaeus]